MEDTNKQQAELSNQEPLSKHFSVDEIPGNPDLNTSQKEDLLKLLILNHYSSIFVRNDNDLGKTTATEHAIETGDFKPIKQPPYRVPYKQPAIIDTEVSKMLSSKVIRPSHSPWASPVVMVPKKTGGFWFCVDYRKLNNVTKKNNYPLPRIDDILETLNQCTYFTTLDQAWGYWQIPLNEADKEKSAFITYNGLYEFNVLPFGLCNAPATFQRLIDLILAGLQWEICLVYLDDILIFSTNFEDHLTRLNTILIKL